MTDRSEIIAQLRALLPKVTPGPWKRFVPDRGYCIDYIVTEAPLAKNEERHSDIVAETTNSTGPRSTSFFEKDSEWIALLDPVNVSALLSRIEELESAADPRDLVAVKALEWDGIRAKSILGEYSIGAIGGEWKALRNDRQIASGLSLTHDGAMLDAKAAAQAHYAGIILSTVETEENQP